MVASNNSECVLHLAAQLPVYREHRAGQLNNVILLIKDVLQWMPNTCKISSKQHGGGWEHAWKLQLFVSLLLVGTKVSSSPSHCLQLRFQNCCLVRDGQVALVYYCDWCVLSGTCGCPQEFQRWHKEDRYGWVFLRCEDCAWKETCYKGGGESMNAAFMKKNHIQNFEDSSNKQNIYC